MTLSEIKKSLVNIFQGKLKNIVSLADDKPLESEYKILKVGEKTTGVELSETDVKINTLDTNTLTIKGINALSGIVDGQILGYTYLQPSSTGYSSFILQTSFTIEDSTHQITFIVPPSGKVEIEATGMFNRYSTSDVTIYAGLSDNATYNSLGATYEYDYSGNLSDDESDDEIITFKWCVTGLTAGTDTTYHIGFKSSDASAVQLVYGYRSTHGLAHHPFIIKATALPSTIYDGT